MDRSLSRDKGLGTKVLFVDGVSGGGKTAVHPLLQGLERVENVVVHEIYEYLCCLDFFGKAERNSVVALLRAQADHRVYDNMISREVNLRPTDVSSVLASNLREMYLNRLFMPDGRPAVERTAAEDPVLHLMLHQAFAVSAPLFQAFAGRMAYVEVWRNPLHVLGHWHSYIERYGNDPTDFTMWVEHEGSEFPWFVAGKEGEFLRAGKMDKVIIGLRNLWDFSAARRAALDAAERRAYQFIPFEAFVTDPSPFIAKVSGLLGTRPRPDFPEIARRQNIPRALSNAGPGGIWTSKYGEAAPGAGATEETELARHWRFAESEASAPALRALKELVAQYEETAAAART